MCVAYFIPPWKKKIETLMRPYPVGVYLCTLTPQRVGDDGCVSFSSTRSIINKFPEVKIFYTRGK